MPCMDLSDYKNFDVMRRLLVVPRSQLGSSLNGKLVGPAPSVDRPAWCLLLPPRLLKSVAYDKLSSYLKAIMQVLQRLVWGGRESRAAVEVECVLAVYTQALLEELLNVQHCFSAIELELIPL